MASYSKRGNSWRVQVSHNGQRVTATFPTKGECKAWANEQESAIRQRRITGTIPNKTVSDVLDRYEKEVSIKKRGYLWEVKRISVIKRSRLASVRLSELSPVDISKWRDERLQAVSGSSVNRDWHLLSHAIETAKREWRWINSNPFKGEVSRPRESPPRDKIFTDDEIKRIELSLGDIGVSGRIKDAFLFALETGMRAGEIVNLRASDCHLLHVHLSITKNGASRDVPLSSKASSILDKYRNNETLFSLTSAQLDSIFRKAKKAAMVEGHFHDTRRTALTRLAKIYTNPMELARISGHRDLKLLMDVYYAPTIQELAEKMNAPIKTD